jgi:meckelin
MVTGVVLYLIRYIFSFLFPLPYMDFVDLCSVANVSLFIFDDKFHGYYIHGESPSHSSDVTLEALKRALDNEGQGNAARRGLVDKYPNLQTYEFYLPYSERKIFDEVFEENTESLKKKKGDEEVYNKKTPKKDFIYKSNDMGMFEEDFRKVSTI